VSGTPGFSFWRGVVGGVSIVALVAVLVIGVRGVWPAKPTPTPAGPAPNNNGKMEMWLSQARPPQGENPKALDWDKDRLDLSEELEFPLNPQDAAAPQKPTFAVLGQLPPFAAMVSAAKTGHILTSSERGELSLYRQSDFTLLHKVMLEGPAYAMVLDQNNGRLYAAVTTTARLKIHPLKGREYPPADIHVYDVKPLLKGVPTGESHLKPLARQALDASVLTLLLDRDGKELFFIAETSRDSYLRRLRTGDLHQVQELPLRNGSVNALSLSPDGSRLFLLASGRLITMDPGAWREISRVVVGLNYFAPVAVNNQHVIMIDRQATLQMVVVDAESRKSLSRWELLGLEGRISLTCSPDGHRVFVGSSGVLHSQVWELDCRGENLTQPVVTRMATSNHQRMLRGGVQISSDGQRLILGNGLVLGGDV
jgi:hypothetical protein